MAQSLTYIRIKRKHETVVLMCEPSQTFASIRTKVASLLGHKPAELALVGPDRTTEFTDEAMVSDHKLADDTVIYALLRTGSGLEAIDLLDAAPES